MTRRPIFGGPRSENPGKARSANKAYVHVDVDGRCKTFAVRHGFEATVFNEAQEAVGLVEIARRSDNALYVRIWRDVGDETATRIVLQEAGR